MLSIELKLYWTPNIPLMVVFISLGSVKAVLTVWGLLVRNVTASNSEGRKAVILNARKGFVLFSSFSSRAAWYPLALGRASWAHYTLRHNMLTARISLTEKWGNCLRQSFDPGRRRLQLFSMDNAFSQNGTLNNADRSSGLLNFYTPDWGGMWRVFFSLRVS